MSLKTQNQDEKGYLMPRTEKQRNRQRRDLKEKSKYHNKDQHQKRERPSLRECNNQTFEVMSLLTQGLTLL